MDKEKDYSKVFKYLREMDVNPNEAIDILKKAVEFNPRNRASVWKMERFQLYLWARLEEDKSGYLSKKAETVRRLVHSKKYEKYYKNFFSYKFKGNTENSASRRYTLHKGKLHWHGTESEKMWHRLEFMRLNHLITDPRQSVFFKSKYFVYENSKKHIPQDIIDRIK